MKTEIILSGIAGEYLVAGELSRRGIIAAVTLRNNVNIDIVASSNDGSKAVSIQVKTRRVDRADGWDLGSKPLEFKGEWRNVFYVFVALFSDPKNHNIDYYVIPKNKLNKAAEQNFLRWQRGKKKSGEARKSERRMFRFKELPQFGKYKDRWDLLGLE